MPTYLAYAHALGLRASLLRTTRGGEGALATARRAFSGPSTGRSASRTWGTRLAQPARRMTAQAATGEVRATPTLVEGVRPSLPAEAGGETIRGDTAAAAPAVAVPAAAAAGTPAAVSVYPGGPVPAHTETGLPEMGSRGGAAARELLPPPQLLERLPWRSTYADDLPADSEDDPYPRTVRGCLYAWVEPDPPEGSPRLLAASGPVADALGIARRELGRDEFVRAVSGAAPFPHDLASPRLEVGGGGKPKSWGPRLVRAGEEDSGLAPVGEGGRSPGPAASAPPPLAYASVYGGHQFGSWAGQLGDGRAMGIGELGGWELQLKGAGLTPLSRVADGRAVLRSSLREYVASEAMASLGVPTTRALSLAVTGDAVARDLFYTGDVRDEPGAVVVRVARSFVRFGSFQLPAARGPSEFWLGRALADHLLERHFPWLLEDGDGEGEEGKEAGRGAGAADGNEAGTEAGGGEAGEGPEGMQRPAARAPPRETERYVRLAVEIAARTGRLVAEWQRVGFVHGVLNTDNMSCVGDTIDYGPYGFCERYDPAFTPNTTDLPGRRYSLGNQPAIGLWNVTQLAHSLSLLGLLPHPDATEEPSTRGDEGEGDEGAPAPARAQGPPRPVSAVATVAQAYVDAYGAAAAEAARRKLGLRSHDPALYGGFLNLLERDQGDWTNCWRALAGVGADDEPRQVPEALLAALGAPLGPESRGGWETWLAAYRDALAAPDALPETERRAAQRGANPSIVPRNHVMQGIIAAAERGDVEPLTRYVDALSRPYNDPEPGDDPLWRTPGPPEPRRGVELLSCSS